VSVSGIFLLLAGGCAETQSQVKEFNRMEVGEGPGEVLSQMIELQKDQGGRKIEAHSPPGAKGEGAGDTSHFSSDYSSGDLSMSRATGGMHDVHPVVPPPGSPPLLVQNDGQSTPSTSSDPVSSASAAPHSSSAPTPDQAAPPPVIASAKPSVPAEIVSAPSPPVSSRENKGMGPHANITLTKRPPAAPPAKPVENYSGGPNYRIGPEDVLHIDVWGNTELTRDVTVRPDGKISLPLIQDIQAEGRTSAELAVQIRDKLLDYIKNPNVSVIVSEINAPKFSILGYVAKPGTYPLRGDLSILQALSQAGGFTPFASPKKIKVIRYVSGKQEVRLINYYDLIEEGNKGQYLLKPGDTIVVP